jgi:hypothetical protein
MRKNTKPQLCLHYLSIQKPQIYEEKHTNLNFLHSLPTSPVLEGFANLNQSLTLNTRKARVKTK